MQIDRPPHGAAARPEPRPPTETEIASGPRPTVEYTQRDARGVRLAQGLGWFSIGLGVTELLAPKLLGRVIGLRGGGSTLMRLMGIREILNGVALLGGADPVRALDARLLGDLLDLTALGISAVRPGNGRTRMAAAAASVLGTAGLDLLARRHLKADASRAERVARKTRIGKAVTVEASPRELYTFWRSLERLPLVMPHIEKVERINAVNSKWSARGPGGKSISWEAEIIDDIPDQLIAWTTIDGPLEAGGVVRFLPAPGGRGTEVVAEMEYHVFGGGLGRAAVTAFGLEPGLDLERGLRRLKQLFELDEVMVARKEDR